MRDTSVGLLALTLVLLLGTWGPVAWAEDDEDRPQPWKLPPGWAITSDALLTPEQRDQVGAKLEVKIDALRVQQISINGFGVKLNTITLPSQKEASTLHAKLAKMRGGVFMRRVGRRVYEAATSSVLATKRLWAAMGLAEEDVATWRFAARLGLVDHLDYMQANPLFNAFLNRAAGREGFDEKAMAKTIASWTVGETLRLGPLPSSATLSFEPKGALARSEQKPWSARFEGAPRDLGLPYVDLRLQRQVAARWVGDGAPKPEAAYVASTRWWPADDAAMLRVARQATRGASTPRERVLALLRGIAQGIRTDGPMGSRHGAKEVLAQRFGHCWDKSDLFITVCRALGIPARQIAGWVPALSAGHVWAEVHLEGEGWIPVDPTTTWLGVSEDYIPLFRSDDGPMPIVYLAMPKIERKS